MRILLLLLVFVITDCASQQNTTTGQSTSNERSESDRLVSEGYKVLVSGNAKDAIEKYFDKAIAQCEDRYSGSKKRVYATRHTTETVYYMLKAAADEQDAIAVSSTCADALYLKGYANLDLGRIEEAEEYINRALEMSPENSNVSVRTRAYIPAKT